MMTATKRKAPDTVDASTLPSDAPLGSSKLVTLSLGTGETAAEPPQATQPASAPVEVLIPRPDLGPGAHTLAHPA